jgi:predicted ATPase/class 3 adenylate cyclase/DNA-binding winged helix-turn-helix (wHTH) protein
MLYIFGEFELDLQCYELRQAGVPCALEPQGFNVLAYLVAHRDRVVSKQELFEQLWPDQSVSEATLTQRLMAARKVLGDSGRAQRYIKTVHGRGYRFVAAVEERATMVASSPENAAPPAMDASTWCPRCQQANQLDAKFCHACGWSLALPCPACAQANPPAARFCHACGTSLTPHPATLPQAPDVAPRMLPPVSPLPVDAERRQLTVMCCDLVDATRLTSQHDPEDWREVVQAYHATCAEVIQHFDGHIAQYLGDALLVYFGWPRAHEDDAQRAIWTGLGILEAMGPLNTRLEQVYGLRLAVRLGIHTGPVVVGDIGGEVTQAQLALGGTPHVAAHMQEMTAPETVVISAATAHLVEGYFTWEDLGAHPLTGVPQPMRLYRVVDSSGVQSRLDVAAARGLTPLVGRQHEVSLLLERWSQVQDGMGQVVVLRGEAGIGKSRLVRVLKEQLADLPYTRVECRGSPYHQHSALYPMMEPLHRMLGGNRDDPPAVHAQKLETFLTPYRVPFAEAVPLLGHLLSLPLPQDRYPLLSWSSEQQRQKTLELLLTLLFAQTKQHPVLLIVEDLHWVDPTTLAWLDVLVEQTPTVPLLAVLTCRPSFTPPWEVRTHVTSMSLQRLSRPQRAIMVERLTDGKRLPSEVLEEILARTDGVPLFVEELTKAVLESGILREQEDHYALTGALVSLRIPTTLQDALMARLDRLDSAKGVAQLGAVLGRQFPYAWLQAVSPQGETTLQRELSRLVEAELLYVRGYPPQATYTFKHALIQETAYQSLLRRTRRHAHQQIAQMLETRFPEVVETHPELVAHHYTEAGWSQQAMPYWQQAGQRAIRRSAHREAIEHLRKGLRLLSDVPDTPSRTQHELALCMALSTSLALTQGYGANEVGHTYARARALCQQLGDTAQISPVLFGLWRFHTVRGELQTGRVFGEALLHHAERLQDAVTLMEAHYTLGTSMFFLGEYAPALEQLEQALALYEAQQHHARAFVLGFDVAVAGLGYAALARWALGYPDQARRQMQEGLRLAQKLAHPHSLALALYFAARLHQCHRDIRAAQEQAEGAITLASEHGFTHWLALSLHLQGWLLVMQGQQEAGIGQIHQGLVARGSRGAAHTYLLALLAEAYEIMGQPEQGLSVLAEALALAAHTGGHWWDAELHRLTGELLVQTNDGWQMAGRTPEACFQQALIVARSQQIKSLELRAATSLARLWQCQDKRPEAYDVLAPVYDWFTEGFDTADLIDARRLLEELNIEKKQPTA